jgi:hypothetical protein
LKLWSDCSGGKFVRFIGGTDAPINQHDFGWQDTGAGVERSIGEAGCGGAHVPVPDDSALAMHVAPHIMV